VTENQTIVLAPKVFLRENLNPIDKNTVYRKETFPSK